MKVEKGMIVNVDHRRKGRFVAKALKDFDTETTEFYPLVLVSKFVDGLNEDWVENEEIPCRASLCRITPLHDQEGA